MARPLTPRERERVVRRHEAVERVERENRERLQRALLARDREIAALVEVGVAVADIARALDLSRQGVYQAIDRAKREQ